MSLVLLFLPQPVQAIQPEGILSGEELGTHKIALGTVPSSSVGRGGGIRPTWPSPGLMPGRKKITIQAAGIASAETFGHASIRQAVSSGSSLLETRRRKEEEEIIALLLLGLE